MKFKLLMVFVDDDKTERVLEASREAGATGATIITNAHGQGITRATGIFGLEIVNPRDVILILVEARRADHVLAALVEAGELDESLNTGIAIALDVEQALGLTAHIQQLESQRPPA